MSARKRAAEDGVEEAEDAVKQAQSHVARAEERVAEAQNQAARASAAVDDARARLNVFLERTGSDGFAENRDFQALHTIWTLQMAALDKANVVVTEREAALENARAALKDREAALNEKRKDILRLKGLPDVSTSSQKSYAVVGKDPQREVEDGGFGAVYHAKEEIFVDGPDAAVNVGRQECENSDQPSFWGD
ncbi:hypothetical protein HDU96_003144 [Phlyctochytrium bullatum]|nr:hypothetical protein HDU96_003144 [Phlyctochytrium bullatum]